MQVGLHSKPQNIWLDAGCSQPDSALCLRSGAGSQSGPTYVYADLLLSISLWRYNGGFSVWRSVLHEWKFGFCRPRLTNKINPSWRKRSSLIWRTIFSAFLQMRRGGRYLSVTTVTGFRRVTTTNKYPPPQHHHQGEAARLARIQVIPPKRQTKSKHWKRGEEKKAESAAHTV